MIRAALCGVLAMVLCAPLQAQQRTSLAPGASLRGLDKISGQVIDFDLTAGATHRLGRLSVTLRECRFPEGNRSGDAFAGLLIKELDKEAPVFDGWMIASAPALSALDHPHYDVWVIRCTTS